MSKQLTQRIAFPDGEVRYIMRACYRKCPHTPDCSRCPYFREVVDKLGEIEAKEIAEKLKEWFNR